MKQEKDTIDDINSETWWKHCGFESFEKWQEFMLKRIIEVSEQLNNELDNKKKRNKYSLFSEKDLNCVKLPYDSWCKLMPLMPIELI